MRVDVETAAGERYPVLVRAGALSEVRDHLAEVAPDAACVVVTDENVDALHGARIRAALLPLRVDVVAPGEAHKTLATVERLLDGFVAEGLDRSGLVVSFGGGVVSDLAGFAAAIHLRGVRHAVIPTTLLAQVDASIGGKTGVDTPRGKNLVGAFWPPCLVLTDPELLATLPRAEWINGLAEALKSAIIADDALFERLEAADVDALRSDASAAAHVVERCAHIKATICSEDERDGGVRQRLNLGHTLGHAFEAAAGFEGLRHGEAVAIGMVAEARIAERLGLAEPGLADRIAAACRRLGLPVTARDVDAAHVRSFLRADKKRAGAAIRFALPCAIGRVELVDIDDPAIIDAAVVDAISGTA